MGHGRQWLGDLVSTFHMEMLPPSSGYKINLNVEAASSSETSILAYHTKRCRIPKDHNPDTYCRENLRSVYSVFCVYVLLSLG